MTTQPTNVLVIPGGVPVVLYGDLPLGAVFRFQGNDGPHTAHGRTLMKIYATECAYRFVDLETGNTWSGGIEDKDHSVLRDAVEPIFEVTIRRK